MRRAGASRRPPSQLSDDPKRHVSNNRRVKLVQRAKAGGLSPAAHAADRLPLVMGEIVAEKVAYAEFHQLGSGVLRLATDAVAHGEPGDGCW